MNEEQVESYFQDLQQSIKIALEAGHKAAALDMVCAAFKLYMEVLEADLDVDLEGAIFDLGMLLASYTES